MAAVSEPGEGADGAVRPGPLLAGAILALLAVLACGALSLSVIWLAGCTGLRSPPWQAMASWWTSHPGAPAGAAVVLMGAIVPMRHRLFRAAIAAGLSLFISKDPP